jgi:ABC-type amino acid transport substrate-binding protein
VYGAEPKVLADVLLLVPADKIEERQAEYPDIEVRPLQFSASELKASHWKFLMGAVGNQATYIRQIMRIMKAMRADGSYGRMYKKWFGEEPPKE